MDVLVNLNKNHAFQKFNREKCVNFSDVREPNIYLHNHSQRKVQNLPIFGEASIYLHNQLQKRCEFCRILVINSICT